jgi:phosphatidylinositol phospholipase C, delta
VLFQQADNRRRGYLDFADFRKFVQALKARPEVERLFKRLCTAPDDTLRYPAFAAFMRDEQRVRSLEALSFAHR